MISNGRRKSVNLFISTGVYSVSINLKVSTAMGVHIFCYNESNYSKKGLTNEKVHDVFKMKLI